MNNQAAQTMPELPAHRGYLHLHNTGGVSQVYGYTADQMHQYARDYAAALSQTAGVAMDCEKCGGPAVHYLVMDNLPPHRRMPFCDRCTFEHEQTAQEVKDHEMRHFGGAYGLVTYHYEPLDVVKPSPGEDQTHPRTGRREGAVKTLLAAGWRWDGKEWSAPAAPAASGGDRAPLSERLYRGPAHDPSGRERGTEPQSTPEPMPPAGASVSERARAIDSPIERLRKIRAACGELSAMVGDGPHREHMAIISGQASLAIEQLQREQALTQQRGECDRAEQIVRDACEVDPADPDHPETICIRRDDLMRIVTSSISGSDGGRTDDGVPCKAHPDAQHGFDRTASHSIGRYVCECEGWSATTPQPGAEALRELKVAVARYMKAHAGYDAARHMADDDDESFDEIMRVTAQEYEDAHNALMGMVNEDAK